MVMNGITAATKASKDAHQPTHCWGTSDWTEDVDDVSDCAIVSNSLSLQTGEALPFLFNLGSKSGANVVVHMAVLNSAHLAGVLETPGLTILHSTTTQEAYDMGFCAHLLAFQGCGPVVHLVDSIRTSFAQVFPLNFHPSAVAALLKEKRHHTMDDASSSSSTSDSKKRTRIVDDVEQVFHSFHSHTRTEYKAFEYFGSATAERVVVATGCLAKTCLEWLRQLERLREDVSKLGVVLVRVSSPWSPSHFVKAFPHSVKVVVAAENVLANAAASFHRESPVVLREAPVFEALNPAHTYDFEDFGHLFAHHRKSIVPLGKVNSSLIREIILCTASPTKLCLGSILGVHLGMKVQDYDSEHERTGAVRKELRFSPLDISSLQHAIHRADIVAVEHPSQLDEALLMHVGKDSIVVVNSPTSHLDLSPLARSSLEHSAGLRLFSVDAEGLVRKHLMEVDAELIPFVLVACALHFCSEVTSYAQVHVHLSSQISHVFGGDFRGLCHELSDAVLASSWLKRVDLDHRQVLPMDHDGQRQHHFESLFHPVVLTHAQPTLDRSEKADDVLQLLEQLFRDRTAVSLCKGSLETSLGAFLGWTAAEKIAKSHWVVCRSSRVQNMQGVHHVLSTGKGMGVVFLCSKVDSVVARDVGLYAMSYGNAYVASVHIEASHAQAVKAFSEAERFRSKGASLLLVYVGDKAQGGEWPLYRWNPTSLSDPFTLDSPKLKSDLHEFLKRDQHLSLLARRTPKFNPTFAKSEESELEKRGKLGAERHSEKRKFSSSFQSMKSGLAAQGSNPQLNLLVLYGSDGGNGASVAEGLAKKAELSGCGESRCMEANEFKLEDLENESVVVFVIATAGQGEDCANAKHFTASLLASKTRLPKLKFAVFGLGDSNYWGEGSADSAKYFCLPARRLHDKLKELGATPLTPTCGLGDDQNDDGYDGALAEWEPIMCKSLNVKFVQKPVMGVHTDDDIKLESNYLRGTIAEGLADLSTGKLVYEDTKMTKFHGIYMQDDRDIREGLDAKGLERLYTFMIRIGVPGGVATAQQYLDMDELCTKYCTGRLKVTTRQAYQFHGILKKDLKTTMQGINRACMDTLAACGDVHRNIIANPRKHDGEVYRQVNELAQAINAHLKPKTSAYHEIWLDRQPVAGYKDHEPLYGPTYLPRKFKVAIAVPPENDVDVFAHCAGFIAIVQNDRLLGYNVCVGGGLGTTHGDKNTYPRLSDVIGFCLPEQAVKVVEAVMVTQRDHGERVNRKHARLKYTVEDHGSAWYRQQVETYCGFKLSEARPFKFETNADKYGWRKGDRTGLWTYTMFVESGFIHDDDPEYKLQSALREIARTMVSFNGEISLTANQNVILGAIPDAHKASILHLLQKHGVDNDKYSQMRLHSMACVALPTCALAMAEAQRYLPKLISKIELILDEVKLRNDAITIRMTGCPNGCARPYLAEIACVGKAPGIYNLHLGGGFAGNRLNRIYREGVNEEQILSILKPLLTAYARDRHSGERFGDFLIRTKVIMPVYHGHSFWAKDESENDLTSRSGTMQLYW